MQQKGKKSRNSEIPIMVNALWIGINGDVLDCPVQFLTVTMNLVYFWGITLYRVLPGSGTRLLNSRECFMALSGKKLG